MLPSDSVFSPAATRLEHLVECRNAVTLLELYNVLADLMDHSRDVIALVGVLGIGKPLCRFPVSIVLDSPHELRVNEAYLPGIFQSLGLVPLYTTLMTT